MTICSSSHCKKESFTDTLLITLYEDCNFSTKANFSQRNIGDYPTIKDMGLNGAYISSIRVPSGLKVTLYEFENYEGRNTVITGDVTCLVNNPIVSDKKPIDKNVTWNDRAYSMRVESN